MKIEEGVRKLFPKILTLTDFPSLGNWVWPNAGEKETWMFGRGVQLRCVEKNDTSWGIGSLYCSAILKLFCYYQL